MSRRRSRRGAEQRQRLLVLMVKVLVAAGTVGFTGYYAYEVGFRVAQGETATLTDGFQKKEERLKAEQAEAEADRLALSETKKQLADLKAAYERIKPSDDIRDLTGLLQNKLDAGMSPRRLALVIKSAETPHDCQVLASRRLQVRVLRSKGSVNAAFLRFDEKVTLSAEEVDAGDGRPPGGGPSNTLHVRFSSEGLRNTDVVGILPIEYALNVQGVEYHFTVTAAAAKGWAEVATEKCSLR